MRLECRPPSEQRAALRAQAARLEEPGVVLAILGSEGLVDVKRAGVRCSVLSLHPDRFVLRAQVRSSAGEAPADYVLKVYSDDLGERVWGYCQALAADHRADLGLCLPSRYIPHERMLVFPWVDGVLLSSIVDDRTPELLRQAAELAARLHRLAIVPEHPTTPQMIVEETRWRYDRLRSRWPDTTPIIEPLWAVLEEVVAALDLAAPAPVHGDMWAGQFLWTGDRLVLFDLDTFGYTDPAYDVGHFLAQLERHRLSNAALPAHAHEWPLDFRDAYLAARPEVSTRNVSFYQGLTLVRKIYTVRLVQPDQAPWLVPQLALRARTALLEAASAGTAP
jgi:hypothetical protein